MVSNYLVGQHMRVRTQEAAAAAAVTWMMFSRMRRVRTLYWRSTLNAIAVVIRGVVVGPVVVFVVVVVVVVVVVATATVVVVVGVVVVFFQVSSPVKLI